MRHQRCRERRERGAHHHRGPGADGVAQWMRQNEQCQRDHNQHRRRRGSRDAEGNAGAPDGPRDEDEPAKGANARELGDREAGNERERGDGRQGSPGCHHSGRYPPTLAGAELLSCGARRSGRRQRHGDAIAAADDPATVMTVPHAHDREFADLEVEPRAVDNCPALGPSRPSTVRIADETGVHELVPARALSV